MVSDRDDNTPDDADEDEHGVLSDTGSIDTTGIGIFGGTAHVSVSMPIGSEDDDLADDDLDDDIVAGELPVDDLHVEPVAATDAAAALTAGEELSDPAGALAGAPAELDDAELEDVDDVVVEAELIDEGPVQDVEPTAEDSVELADVDAAGDGALADDDFAAEAAVIEDAEDAAPIDPYAAFAAAGFTADGVPPRLDEDEPEIAAEQSGDLDDDVLVVEDDTEDEPEVDVAPGDTTTDADASGLDDVVVDEIIVDEVVDDLGDDFGDDDLETDDEGEAVDEVKPITDPLTRSALRQAMTDAGQDAGGEHVNETDRVHETERIAVVRQEVALTSKRVGEFEPNRESADLLTADRLLDHAKVGRVEPEGAWQQLVYSLSLKRINLGDSKRARARKELDGRIAATLAGGARFIPVLSRKGGVGKTTVTALLGMALADARDDRVIAIDANPDRGTLAERISRPSGRTVRDLARLRGSVTGFNDISTIVARDETRLDVISSDADPHVSEAFSDHDYRDVASVAAHYYSLVLTDTGTGIVHSVMGATLDMADELVIVAGLSVDEARLASETLTWLETNGFADKVRRAVVVLNNQRPGSPLVLPDELEAHFRSRARAVVRIPYDAHIAAGSAISFRELQPATRDAARELAAIVVEGLRQLDQAA